ncbi:MAG: hypothetical protein JSW25_05585 [Thermoplasmata archaeon]|nr:MAG: hypothetical protein JSW25_05585 [Thermoplasmata archaeon]
MTLIMIIAAAGALALLGTSAEGANSTPETADPLDQYNYITEYVNGSDDEAEYWYWMDIDRGDQLFVYFYGTGSRYNRTRMLYYVHGPDSYGSNDVVHAEYWYRQKADRDDYTDLWVWICPEGGRYYFHFFAAGEARGDFHANISRDPPETIYRFGSDTGTLWWGGVTDHNHADTYRIWLSASSSEVQGVEVTVTWPTTHKVHLYAYDLVDRYAQNLLNLSYSHDGDPRKEVIRFTASYTGWYYVQVRDGSWTGSVDYTLATQFYSAPNDGDNDVANATHVLKSSSIRGSIEASRDMHDWYTVDLVQGDLLGISMQIEDPYNPDHNPGATNLYNFFEIQVYDPHMRRVRNGYDANGGWPVPDTFINNLPIQPADITMNGTFYIRASFSNSWGWNVPAVTGGHIISFCDYTLQLTIPNRAPKVNLTALEDVYILEDTTWWENLAGENVSSLDLDTVFLDPELGVMTFSVSGDENVTARLVDDHLMTLKPAKNWNGEAWVDLRADDDSGNHATARLRVLVIPVNDPPMIYFPYVFEFLEDDPSVENRTINLYDFFYDIDEDDRDNLTFYSMFEGPVTVTIDQGTGNATFEVEKDVNGVFHMTFTATDPGGMSNQGSIELTVVPVNDPPKDLGGQAFYDFYEGFMLETFDAADHIVDPDGDTELMWVVEYLNPVDEDRLSVNNEGKSVWNSIIVLTPATNMHDWFGQMDVLITCTDQGGLSGSKVFTIVIHNTPDPPEIAGWTPRTDAEFAEGESFTFSIDDVVDPDGEDVRLHFSFWLLSPGDPTAREVANGTEPSWDMVTDFESEGKYKVTVWVFDEDLMASVTPIEWQVTVTGTNRAPTVSIEIPTPDERFDEGEWVEFRALVEDPDAEDRTGLVVDWYEGETWLGKGKTFSVRNLKPGTHVVTAVVTDPGDLSAEASVTIKVKAKQEEPGFGGQAALFAMLVLPIVWAALRGRSNRW